jgi:hypothetical protein
LHLEPNFSIVNTNLDFIPQSVTTESAFSISFQLVQTTITIFILFDTLGNIRKFRMRNSVSTVTFLSQPNERYIFVKKYLLPPVMIYPGSRGLFLLFSL